MRDLCYLNRNEKFKGSFFVEQLCSLAKENKLKSTDKIGKDVWESCMPVEKLLKDGASGTISSTVGLGNTTNAFVSMVAFFLVVSVIGCQPGETLEDGNAEFLTQSIENETLEVTSAVPAEPAVDPEAAVPAVPDVPVPPEKMTNSASDGGQTDRRRSGGSETDSDVGGDQTISIGGKSISGA